MFTFIFFAIVDMLSQDANSHQSSQGYFLPTITWQGQQPITSPQQSKDEISMLSLYNYNFLCCTSIVKKVFKINGILVSSFRRHAVLIC